MSRKFFQVIVLGLGSAAVLFAGGCSSSGSEKPYALTGDQNVYGANGAGSNSPLTAQERARLTDQKGRFHPEWITSASR